MASEYCTRLHLKKLTMHLFYSATLTVKLLKELCRKNGLKVTGTKATLILQLENADRKAQEGGNTWYVRLFIYLLGM